MDMPMVSDGAFGYFMVSEFAKRHVKVSLTGHGGDEVFAGYPAQFQAAFNTTEMFRLHVDPDRQPRKASALRRALHRGPSGIVRALRARAAMATGARSLEDTWIALHCNRLPGEDPILHPAFIAGLNGYSPRDEYIAPLTHAPTDDVLDRCLYHDLQVYLPSLLHLEDRLSMAVSLESRVPLLDHRIPEFLATVPSGQKVAGLRPKHLLREAASRLLPREVYENRDKRGFPVPGRFWKSPRLAQTVKEILLSKACVERGVFNVETLREACTDSGTATPLWPLLNVELWFRIFIDQDPFWVGKTEEVRANVARV
jgi:asparagine synthase (glutamine-hydrolysing)